MNLEEFIQSIDIVDYISQFVELEERNGEYWGLSPFKDEKTPSFSVRRDPPFFFDFSSGNGGNIVEFVKLYFGCSSGQAVNRLKEFTGVDGNNDIISRNLPVTRVIKKFQAKGPAKKESIAKPLPDDYMKRYEWRDDKLQVWRDEGISDSSMKRFQVRYDEFSKRIVYPVRDMNGRILNIGGRTIEPDWKERGLKKYCYFFPWGSINTIYGAFENMETIKKRKEIILFEGCKSVLIADTWGCKNAGAILTSHLSVNQMKILAGLGCRVVFALDKDVNIFNDKNIEKLRRYTNVEYIYDRNGLLSEKDSPVDKGRDVFAQLYRDRRQYR